MQLFTMMNVPVIYFLLMKSSLPLSSMHLILAFSRSRETETNTNWNETKDGTVEVGDKTTK